DILHKVLFGYPPSRGKSGKIAPSLSGGKGIMAIISTRGLQDILILVGIAYTIYIPDLTGSTRGSPVVIIEFTGTTQTQLVYIQGKIVHSGIEIVVLGLSRLCNEQGRNIVVSKNPVVINISLIGEFCLSPVLQL